jgi:hypothetical protein
VIGLAFASGNVLSKDGSPSEGFPTFEKPDDADTKYYCGRCCGWDIYCNIKNPFINSVGSYQSIAGIPDGQLLGLETKSTEISPKYFCFSCCGKNWYCTK